MIGGDCVIRTKQSPVKSPHICYNGEVPNVEGNENINEGESISEDGYISDYEDLNVENINNRKENFITTKGNPGIFVDGFEYWKKKSFKKWY